VEALRGVDLQIRKHEIHALVGENGAGKSTLINILTGRIPRDSGQILVRGRETRIHRRSDAQAQGIAVLEQHPQLVGGLDVAANLFLGRETVTPVLKRVRHSEMRRRAESLLESVGIEHVRSTTLARNLDVGEIQMVAICQALLQEPAILILDEPTASLDRAEVELLFRALRRLREQDVGILYVSHRMEEVFELADRITVMRNGEIVGTRAISGTKPSEIIRMMIGKELVEKDIVRHQEGGEARLEVYGLAGKGKLRDVSFTLRHGTALGVFGVRGAGQHELAQTLVGAAPVKGGVIRLEGSAGTLKSPAKAFRVGKMGYVPSDRHKEGLILSMSIQENVTLPILQSLSRFGWVFRRREMQVATRGIDTLSISCSGANHEVRYLSGGNQQKVVLAKWLMSGASLYILEDPTKGVDVGTKEELYGVISSLVEAGSSVVLISSELREIMTLTDTVIVLKDGYSVFQSKTAETCSEELLNYAMQGSNVNQ